MRTTSSESKKRKTGRRNEIRTIEENKERYLSLTFIFINFETATITTSNLQNKSQQPLITEKTESNLKITKTVNTESKVE